MKPEGEDGPPSLLPPGMQGGKPMAALPPGVEPPPGVPADLLARHMQLDQSHAAARALEAPAGPLGPIGGPANGEGIPPPGTGPGGPQGPLTLPRPGNLPPGTEGASDIEPFPQQFAKAPTLPGMGAGKLSATDIDSALGGVIAGQLRAGAKKYHDKRRQRLPRAVTGR